MSAELELTDTARLHIDKAVDALVDEFGELHSRETVDRVMDDSLRSLVNGANVDDFVPALAHRFMRERLKALARAHGPESAQPDVLFVGLGDTGRGQMDAALLTLRSDGSVLAHSAGSDVEIPEETRHEDWRVGDPTGAPHRRGPAGPRRHRAESDGAARGARAPGLLGRARRGACGRRGRSRSSVAVTVDASAPVGRTATQGLHAGQPPQHLVENAWAAVFVEPPKVTVGVSGLSASTTNVRSSMGNPSTLRPPTSSTREEPVAATSQARSGHA
jgi:Protein-tyrosine-phosphatase-like, N-terminal domain